MKNLIIVRAGDRSLHPGWIDSVRSRDLDIFVSYYGDEFEKYEEHADFYEHVSGLKYPVVAQCLSARPDLLSAYDAIWIPDDDLLADSATIGKMFELFHKHELWLAQPALGRGSFTRRKVLKVAPNSVLRYTNFVEIMAPLFSRYALTTLLPTFTSSASGWGLDYIWPHLLGYPRNRIAILDATPVIHTRPIRSGSFYRRCAQMGVRPGGECRRLLAKHGFLHSPKICVYNTLATIRGSVIQL
jgi:hypothetical protein